MAVAVNWNYPTALAVGEGRLFDLPQLLKNKHHKKAFLVVDPFIKQQTYFDTLLTQLTNSNIETTIYDAFHANPTDSDINNASLLMHENPHDVVIVVGGGSALDVAKTVALVANQSRALWDFEDVGENYLRADTAKILPVIAIPTTAGTGSEVGRAAVITDSQQQTKRLIFHPQMLPSQVILDPLLTVSIPPALTAATGMDAFAHNLEAFLAPAFHPMADGIALEGCRLIKENLPVAFRDGNNIEARQNMLVASTMGATAFQKGLGVIHSLSHPVGAMFGHHHGLLNALFMPYSLIFNRDQIEQKCIQLCVHLDLTNPSFDTFLKFVIELIQMLKLPLTLKQIGMGESAADIVAEKALADPSCATNPKPLTLSDLKEVYINALNGNLT